MDLLGTGTAIGLAFSMLCCTAILSIDLKAIRKRLDRIQEELGNCPK